MVPYVVVSIISAILVTLINVYCVVIIISSRKVRSPPHMTIFSLLLGHALQGMFVIPCYAAKKSGIYKHTIVCEIFRFSYLLTNYWCCLSVLVITIDRFIGVQFPLKYKVWVTRKRLSRAMFCVWLYVLILCLIPFAPSDSKTCKYNPQKQWVITMLIVNTLIPFIIVMILYIFIFKKIKIVLKGKLGKVNRSKTELKRAKITFFIVATYVLCWGPSLLYYLLLTLCHGTCFHKSFHDSKSREIVGFLIKFLTFIDGLIAPLIYCFASRHFNMLRNTVFASIRRKITTNNVTIRFKRKPVIPPACYYGEVCRSPTSRCKYVVNDVCTEETIIGAIIDSNKVSIRRRRISCHF